MLTKLSIISNGLVGKNKILTEIARYAERILEFKEKDSSRVLEIASDKEPVFLSFLAREHPESYFVHFKDDEIRSPKVHPNYESIDNLEIIYFKRALKRSVKNHKYDVIVGFFTLHELNNPKKSLEKTRNYLKDDGKLIIIDYNLEWFKDLAKQNRWDKKTAKQEFSKYIFNARNEQRVLGMKNGKLQNNPDVEAECMANHTNWGPEKCVEDCLGAGYEQISLKSYSISTPWGERPKMFLYVGKKA